MHDPAPNAIRFPRHVKGFAGIEVLGDNFWSMCNVVSRRMLSIADAIHAEVKTVQVHGMIEQAGVNETPVHGFAHMESEVLGVWPRLAIDSSDLLEVRKVSLFAGVPHVHYEHSVVDRRTHTVDDERAGEQRVLGTSRDDRSRTRRGPVVICACGSWPEADFTRASRRNL